MHGANDWIMVPLALTQRLWNSPGGCWGESTHLLPPDAEFPHVHVIGVQSIPDRVLRSVQSKTWKDLKDVVMILGWDDVEARMDEWERRAGNA